MCVSFVIVIYPYHTHLLFNRPLYTVPVNFDRICVDVTIYICVKAGVGYKRQNELLFSYFLDYSQAVSTYRSFSLI